MVKFPEAPTAAALAALGRRTVEEIDVAADALLWRVHRTSGEHPTGWNELRCYGPVAAARFDPHPEPPARYDEGALYLARDIPTAIAETFQSHRVIDRHTGGPYLTGLRLNRAVRLLDLSGTWPTRAGASQAINTGPRRRARGWARAIRAAFPDLEGLSYPSSMHAGTPCVVLWRPAQDCLPDEPVVSVPLDHPALAPAMAALADRLGYLLR